MAVQFVVLVTGIILVITSGVKLKRQNNYSAQRDKQNQTSFNANLSNRSNLLASEILQEMEESTEEMIRKLSNKEMELESFLNTADNKIARLQALIEQEATTGGLDVYAGEAANTEKSQQLSRSSKKVATGEKLAGESGQSSQNDVKQRKALNIYTPATITKRNEQRQQFTEANQSTPNGSKQADEEKAYDSIDQNDEKNAHEAGDNDNTIAFMPKYMEKHKDVITLWREGYSLTQIARQTGKGKGEAQLIINLYKQNGGSNKNGS